MNDETTPVPDFDAIEARLDCVSADTAFGLAMPGDSGPEIDLALAMQPIAVDLRDLLAYARQVREVLTKVNADASDRCVCCGEPWQGHAPDCRLAALLVAK